MPVFRSTCPRHCYSSCGIISSINGGKLTRVLGDPQHGFTQGRLCPKGYALIQYALDKHRLKFPMKQVSRGSNEWRKISWEEAYALIAEKALELNMRYGSNLSLGYIQGKGNTGFLHQAVRGMFAGMGPHTRPIGDICFAGGESALNETVGEMIGSDPEEMSKAGLIILWGANPAVTNINQMKFIYEARKNKGRLVVIDPILTKSAERADLYIQINPGTDAWLAWGIAKLLLKSGRIDPNFICERTIGFENYVQELNKVNLDEVCSRTGVCLEALRELADLYTCFQPIACWLGFGLQRNYYGTLSVKAISALTALTGDFDSGGGLYFRHNHLRDFPQALARHQEKKHPAKLSSRVIPANDYARQALKLDDPPLKMLWVSCGNPLAQGHNLRPWRTLFQQLDLIITVDLYLTRTAEQSDLILPAASFFEEEDLHLSFWHYWLTFNQQVLPSFYEARSDLQIARELTVFLNLLQPGFSDFPADKAPNDWIEEEISPRIKELYGLDNVNDLNKNSYKRREGTPSPSRKYHFPVPEPHLFAPIKLAESYPYLLLTPQSLLKFHTQYETLSWLNAIQEPVIEISAKIARKHMLNDDSFVEIFNENGTLRGLARINDTLPPDIILTEQSGRYPVNNLMNTPYFDCKVNIRRVRKYV